MTAKSKLGRIFVGDPYEIMSGETYDGIWGDIFNFEDGVFETNGATMVIAGTNNMDGSFKTDMGFDVYTSSSSVALIPAELFDDEKAEEMKGQILDMGVASFELVKKGDDTVRIDVYDDKMNPVGKIYLE